jgi:hypothetical protein
VDPAASFSADGVGSLLKYAYGLSPLLPTPAGAGLEVTAAFSDPNTISTYTFQRDAAATDLTYVLEASSDLVGWAPIVQSAGGAVASGAGFLSESAVSGQIKLVTAQETVPPPGVRYVRLRISRAQ